jgi:O-antigen/teichoic acid export membrane protein
MTVARSFAKNVFFKGIGEIFIRLLSFAFIVLVARTVGDEQFGVLNFAFSFALLFVVIVDFGLNPLLVRDGAKHIEQTANFFFNLLIIKLGLTVIFCGVFFIGLHILAPQASMMPIAYAMAGFVMLNSFAEFINTVFHAHQKMQFEAAVMTLQKMALLGLGLLALSLGWGVFGIALAYVVAAGLSVLIGIGILWRGSFLQGTWKLEMSFMRYALRQALPLTLTTLFINLYFRIDMTLLTKFRTAEEVGWYGAAHKCIEVLMVVPAILVVAAFPGMSKLFQENRKTLIRAATKLLRLLLLLGLPIAGGAILIANPLVLIIFGKEYAAAGSALSWLAVALCCIFVNYALSYLLISGGKQKVNAVVSGLAVLVSIGSNLLLIPRLGYLGAAISATITEVFLLAAYAISVKRLLFSIPVGMSLLRIALATAGMMVVVWFLRESNPVVSISTGVVIYILGIWLFRAIEKDDVDLLQRIFKRTKA